MSQASGAGAPAEPPAHARRHHRWAGVRAQRQDGYSRHQLARFSFLDERSRGFYPDWEAASDISVAILRTEAGRDPRDKQLHHHIVGGLTLSYEGLELTAEPGLSFLIYAAEPGSESQERLDLLASWVADARQSDARTREVSTGLGTTATNLED